MGVVLASISVASGGSTASTESATDASGALCMLIKCNRASLPLGTRTL